MSYADMVEAHEKSVVLGGAITLFPVAPSVTQAFARQIKMAISRAENAAFKLGYEKAQADMRAALGI